MKPLQRYNITMGCDPEFFFAHGNRTVEANDVIPKDGLVYSREEQYYEGDERATRDVRYPGYGKVVIDGVQAELNPAASTCRQALCYYIQRQFMAIAKVAKEKKLGVNFSRVVELSDDEMKNLSKDAKKFGCMPSRNAHQSGKESIIKVKAAKYNKRSAGGHIHLGTGEFGHKEYQRIIRMLDVLLGNTCVMIDRDPSNAERRKVYGKAGEFRLPPHGVEYRTLSNFWLQSIQLTSFVTGMARMAYSVVYRSNPDDKDSYENQILSKINIKNIVKAININDFDLAKANFDKIKDVIMEMTDGTGYEVFPLYRENMKQFEYFVSKGIDYWFDKDSLKHWTTASVYSNGWEKYMSGAVKDDMESVVLRAKRRMGIRKN